MVTTEASGESGGTPDPGQRVDRKVIIIMSFGGNEERAAAAASEEDGAAVSRAHRIREYQLYFRSMKHIIEDLIPREAEESDRLAALANVRFSVEVAFHAVGDIPHESINKILQADILIAFVDQENSNVIFELAIRNMLKPQPILIVEKDHKSRLPIYIQDMANIEFDEARSRRFKEAVQDIAKDTDLYPLDWSGDTPLPELLGKLIPKELPYLIKPLARALNTMETCPPGPPDFLRRHVVDLDPGALFSTWETYFPYSVIRILWQKKADGGYRMQDMIGEPVVYSAKTRYFQLLRLSEDRAPDPEGDDPLTITKVMARLQRLMTEEDYREFKADQDRLSMSIIFNDENAWARVPIRLKDKNPELAGRVWFPRLVGKRVVGSQSSKHAVFLAIVFTSDREMDVLENGDKPSD